MSVRDNVAHINVCMISGSYPPIGQFMSRKFIKPHGAPLVLFLKTGIGGLLVYYFTMLLFFRGRSSSEYASGFLGPARKFDKI